MSEREIILAFLQILPIILIWIRMESRLSRLEGRFDMYMDTVGKLLIQIEKRH